MATYRGLELALKTFEAQYRAGAIEAARQSMQAQVNTLNEVTREWAHRVQFAVKVESRTGFTRFRLAAIGTKEALKIFHWVDAGTKPHIIRPKSPNKALVFFTPYSARTAPIANANAGTGRAGNTKNVRRFVRHPGNDPRLFIAFTSLEAEEDFKARMQALIRKLGR